MGNRQRTTTITTEANITTETAALANAKERIKPRCHVSSICEITVAPIHALTVGRTVNAPRTKKGQHFIYGAQNKKLLMVDNIPQRPRERNYWSAANGIILANAILVKSAGTKIHTSTSIDPEGATIRKQNRLEKGKAKVIERKAGNLRRIKEAKRGKGAGK